MTQFASVQNDLFARATNGQPTPTVGMGATLLRWSDRHAATIIAVKLTKTGCWRITVQHDKAAVVSGSAHDGSAEYEYSADPTGMTEDFEFDPAKKRWFQLGPDAAGRLRRVKDGSGITIGRRESYRDPSF